VIFLAAILAAIIFYMPEDFPPDLREDVRAQLLPIVKKAREAGWQIRATWESERERWVTVRANSQFGGSVFLSCEESQLVERLGSALQG
jgi:hypothetical protein